jgi:histidinol-phosphate/aromatic aminotransferase/cobyric acid decarboxylase-like protein
MQYAAIAALEDQDYLKEITRKNAKEREKFYNIEQSKVIRTPLGKGLVIQPTFNNSLYNACGLSVTTNTKFV